MTTYDFNPRIASMQPSQTLAITGRGKELKRQGINIVSLSAGEPDFPTPKPIVDAAIASMHAGHFGYTENAGLFDLRAAICDKLSSENGLTYDPSEILCSNGAKQSIAQAVQVLCRPGDDVLIPAPYWVSYPEMVKLADGNPVIIPSTVENEYMITAEELEAAITPRSRLIILCTPSNPTGSVYSPEHLEQLAAVLRKYPDILVISDEIYEKVIYDAVHLSFAALPGMFERTVTVNGFSKAYAMTGWRLGYLAAPAPITKAASKLQGQTTSAPNHTAQRAGITALTMGPEPLDVMVAAFRERRDYLLRSLRSLPEIECPKPEGAFYLFPDVSAYFGSRTRSGKEIANASDLCLYLLEECHVATVMGDAFGDPNGLRLSYAASMQDLELAVERIGSGLAKLSR